MIAPSLLITPSFCLSALAHHSISPLTCFAIHSPFQCLSPLQTLHLLPKVITHQVLSLRIFLTSSRPPQNINVLFLSCIIAISWPKYSTHSHKHIKPYEHTLPQNVECQLACITSETDWENACALSALPPPCPGAN